MHKKIVLTGVKHSGKSFIGVALAQRLEFEFIDLDDVILDLYNLRFPDKVYESVRPIYRNDGKEVFMDYEKAAVMETLKKESCIIAAGGGLSDNVEVFKRLKEETFVVFLDASSDLLYSRIIAGGIPPFLDQKNPELHFKELYNQRVSIYKKMADCTINVEQEDSEKTVQAIINQL